MQNYAAQNNRMSNPQLVNKSKILLIEDEPAISDAVIYALESEGFDVFWCNTGASGISLLKDESPDLVLLDIGLPDINGFEVFQKARSSSQIPIIFLTARKEEVDKVTGLEMGGDDYIVKPFSPRELTARVRAVLRRINNIGCSTTQIKEDKDELVNGPFIINYPKWSVAYQSVNIDLTHHELQILSTLVKSPRQIFTREMLLETVWDAPEHRMDRTVDTHIKNIRAKLRAIDSTSDPVKTKRGVGYFTNWDE